jgi:anti-anti-sigma factor
MGSLDLQQLHRFDGACILSVGGEIDDSTVDAFAQGLEASLANSRRLVVDLTMCTMSSDGLAALAHFHRCTRDRVAVTLVAREPCLLRMLHAVGLTATLGTHPTVSAALSSEAEHAPAAPTSSGRTRRSAQLELAVER